MSKTIITIIIIIVIAIEFGYFSFRSMYSPKEEIKDDIAILFNLLRQDTSINFSDSRATDVRWNIRENQKTETLTIKGQGFQAKNISSKEYRQIQVVLGRSGFGLDLYNISIDTAIKYMGYAKNQFVCTVATQQLLDDKGMPLENGAMDVTVKCGQR